MNTNNPNQLKNVDTNSVTTKDSQIALLELENEMFNAFLNDSSNLRINSRDAVSFGINFSTKILSLLGVPFAAQIGQLWNFTLNTMWPKQDNTWDNLISFVEELINEQVEKAVRSKAIKELEGLGKILEIYYQALSDWQNDPNNKQNKIDVIAKFGVVDLFFEKQMPSFAVEEFEVPLLAVYAYAANLHLLLLRDCSIYGKEWGLNSNKINEYYERQLKRTIEYSDHCTDWYSIGLDDLKGSNAQSWAEYNKYRREMTLNVLDICSLFSNYDYRKYRMETNMELTRDIYTDLTMSNPNWLDNFPSFNIIEEKAIRKQHTITWLNTLEIYTGRIVGWKNPLDYWKGHKQTYSETIAGNNFNGQLYGRDNNPTQTSKYELGNNDIYSINSTPMINVYSSGVTGLGIAGSNFDYKNLSDGNSGSYTYGNNNNPNIITQLPGNDTDVPSAIDYSHRLTYITGLEVLRAGLILCACWTSKSVDRNNTLDDNAITEIPGVKSHSLNKCEIVKGSGSTGGDLLKATNSNSSFGLNVRSLSNQTYCIRLRYAANTSNTLNILCSDAGINTSVTIPETGYISNDDFSYELFGYLDLLEFKTNPTIGNYKDYKFNFTFSNVDMYIDRFEFIPIT